MRNPFPKIGKIIKYEFKHSARKLLPLYGVLLFLGLLTGLSYDGKKTQEFIEGSTTGGSTYIEINGEEAAQSIITGLLIATVSILITATVIITIVTIARRFEQSMLGEEAYLNLSLPCTMGEQLWGRFIIDFLWFLGCAIVLFLTFLLCFIKLDIPYIIQTIETNILPDVKDQLTLYNMTFSKIIGYSTLVTISFCFWLITTIFTVNAISHLFSQNKGFFKFITFIAIIILFSKTLECIPFPDAEQVMRLTNDFNYIFTRNSLLLAGATFIWSAIQFAITQFIFTKKLNLE